MKQIEGINDFVVKFANVNGTGSASANHLFAKAIFRMGIPVSPRNIFPSNIQGLPTWYEVRVSKNGYLGRRGGVDFMVCVNPQSMEKDIAAVEPGGYFLYDNTKPLAPHLKRDDITMFGIPLTEMCMREYANPRLQQLLKNVVYVGAMAALIDIDFRVLKDLLNDQFKGKEKLISSNVHALEMGYQYATENFQCPLPIRLEAGVNLAPHILESDHILMNGNTRRRAWRDLRRGHGGGLVSDHALDLGGGCLPRNTPNACASTRAPARRTLPSCRREDELAAMGMVVGAGWNGARAFTATSGPGLSLMSEFLGLAYFAELPVVLINVQRSGPSTGMPTRSQQSDVLAAAYASHGDTKHVLLFPRNPFGMFRNVGTELRSGRAAANPGDPDDRPGPGHERLDVAALGVGRRHGNGIAARCWTPPGWMPRSNGAVTWTWTATGSAIAPCRVRTRRRARSLRAGRPRTRWRSIRKAARIT